MNDDNKNGITEIFNETAPKTEDELNQTTQQEEVAEEETPDTPALKPEPSWVATYLQFTRTEELLPFILTQPRPIENIQEEQNYDVIADNNIDVAIDLKGEWDEKVWEAPTLDIGDD